MKEEYKVKNITSLYESCNNCGLPKLNCICSDIEPVKSKSQIWILSSKKELIRPSNTARLLKIINKESTEVFIWERTKPPEELIRKIESNIYDVYLLFPVDEENIERQVEFKKTDKIPAFLIIDGTWKEAKKIFRKSPYLNSIDILSLVPNSNSKYELRRGIDEGNLCTIETAIETLYMNDELEICKRIEEYFSLFQSNYKAGLSGHRFKK